MFAFFFLIFKWCRKIFLNDKDGYFRIIGSIWRLCSCKSLEKMKEKLRFPSLNNYGTYLRVIICGYSIFSCYHVEFWVTSSMIAHRQCDYCNSFAFPVMISFSLFLTWHEQQVCVLHFWHVQNTRIKDV